MKICTLCQVPKPIFEFYEKKLNSGKFRSECKKCTNKNNYIYNDKNQDRKKALRKENYIKNREKELMLRKIRTKNTKEQRRAVSLKARYGITIEQYNSMLLEQNNLCKICSNPETLREQPLSVDHCHKTGKIRGLLCDKCNRAIGILNDNPLILRKAADYLESKILDLDLFPS